MQVGAGEVLLLLTLLIMAMEEGVWLPELSVSLLTGVLML